MSAQVKTALIVEDDDATAELEARVLRRMGMTVCTAGTTGEAILALDRQLFSIVLLDHKLSDGPSWPVLDAAQKAGRRIPVIMVTGMGDERVAAEAIHRGAIDYVVKSGNFWERLPLLVLLAIKRSEAERSKAHLASVVESSPDAIVSMMPDGTIQSWNAAAQRIYGFSTEEALGANISILSQTGTANDFSAILAHVNEGKSIVNRETARTGKDGRQTPLSLTLAHVKDESGRVIGLSMIVHELAERNAQQSAEQTITARNAFLSSI